ncbi:hypothetical protein K2173_017943 [Erythroxylum novogranatense]|uniref:Wax synthase domain-containing protein n=1 Tax=Erythroxylum novogranatense TaxID=1862640 RepID=A0AAV8TTX1_9ROSI|nr:hypothetical protein K2173_017943 [Erythroxylum novogranatense]
MEEEVVEFFKVWLIVIASLSSCYAIRKVVPKGTKRLLCVLPVVCLFLTLPLRFTWVHFSSTTAFFISWLANFKLLLFAFGKGPLSSDPSLSLPLFVSVASLPINIQQTPPQNHNPPHQNGKNKETPYQNSVPERTQKSFAINYTTKALLLALLMQVYQYNAYVNAQILMLVQYCLVYFYLELLLALVAKLIRMTFGLELEPQFNEPYLSSSLQDFWGRRWNLMVSNILRPTVYEPVRNACTPLIGRRCSQLSAMFATFVVSGIMHELIFFYLGRGKPTWEITCFFLLHGLCLVGEVAVKKVISEKWRLPRLISMPLSVGFVLVTGSRLFFPPLLRCDVFNRALKEYALLGALVKEARFQHI